MFLEWENSSGKFQNNINDVKQVSLSHVIKKLKWSLRAYEDCFFRNNLFTQKQKIKRRYQIYTWYE